MNNILRSVIRGLVYSLKIIFVTVAGCILWLLAVAFAIVREIVWFLIICIAKLPFLQSKQSKMIEVVKKRILLWLEDDTITAIEWGSHTYHRNGCHVVTNIVVRGSGWSFSLGGDDLGDSSNGNVPQEILALFQKNYIYATLKELTEELKSNSRFKTACHMVQLKGSWGLGGHIIGPNSAQTTS